jgi:hypothetical protein
MFSASRVLKTVSFVIVLYILYNLQGPCLALEDGTDRFSRNVGPELPILRCVKSQKSAYLDYFTSLQYTKLLCSYFTNTGKIIDLSTD